MALKPTIYKAQIELADSDRNCYESLSLTVAKHPSETLERMMVRLLAYCLNCTRGLEFTKGISTADEPDLWVHSDSGEIEHWIEVGHPEEARLRKACGRARQVSVYAFAKSTPTWWKLNNEAISALPHLHVWLLDWTEIQSAADLLNRTVQLNVSIVGGILYLDNGSNSTSVEPILLCQTD
ncbi:MAG: YaeQ family protein [Halioglobus sp.]